MISHSESVANIRNLADPERRHGVSKASASAGKRPRDEGAKLAWRVGAPDGQAPIQHIHAGQAERCECAEQRERQGMAHEIENDESLAGAADVVDQLDELLIPEVMHEADADGDVGGWQRVMDGVEFQYGKLWRGTLGRPQINADDVRSQLAAYVPEQPAVTTPDVEDALDGRSLTPQRPENRRVVTQQPVG